MTQALAEKLLPDHEALKKFAEAQLVDNELKHADTDCNWCDLARAYLDLATRLETEQWRTMESAPKDGTRILIADQHGIWIARWNEEADFGELTEQRPGWQIFACEGDTYYAEASDTATHFRPLPQPPGERT